MVDTLYARRAPIRRLTASLEPEKVQRQLEFYMFCPKCGLDGDDLKFCRGCGENLKAISQAMSRRLPAFLVRKMDAYIETKNRGLRRQSIGNAALGSVFMFLGLYEVIGRGASWANEWFYVAYGGFMLFLGLWDYMVFKRSLSTEVRIVKMGGSATTDELLPNDAAQIAESPASVTESTTKQLDLATRGQERS